jgi:hypothetical protein
VDVENSFPQVSKNRTNDPRNKVRCAGSLLQELSELAVKPNSWARLKVAGVLWRALTNLSCSHRDVLALGKNPIYAEHLKNDPRFLFKYLTHDYLARSMSVPARAACFVHHYRRLSAILPAGLIKLLLAEGIELAAIDGNGRRFTVDMVYSWPKDEIGADKEGELSLNLRMDGTFVYVLSFSIVPGRAIGCKARDVLLISRLQGERGRSETVTQFYKSLHYLKPDALLMAALSGIGKAFGIERIACVRGQDQTAYQSDLDHDFQTAYDEFFSALGVPTNAAGYYVSPIPLPEKPLEDIRGGKRQRSRARRAIKQQVSEDVHLLLKSWRESNSYPPVTDYGKCPIAPESEVHIKAELSS